MSTLTMPSITIAFATAAESAVSRSQKGTVALILRDAALAGNHYELTRPAAVPDTMGAENKAAVNRAFLGYVRPPRRVLLYVLDAAAPLKAALSWLETQQFDYLAGPDTVTAAEATSIAAWVKTQRTERNAICKAVLPDTAADSEGIVNFTTAGIVSGTETFSAAAYCGRMAGLLAGTPMELSGTFATLPEVSNVTRLTQAEMNTAVGAGKLLLWYDGEKVKTGRAVNSLQTMGGKTAVWKKIKIVEFLDMVQRDIRKTAQDTFIGKYPNTYDSRMLLVTAIRDYLARLAREGLLAADFLCDIDVRAVERWLQWQGVDTTVMSEQQIRESNTDTEVYLKLTLRPVDSIEDISVLIYL
ncbi:MAG: phage tail sheath C-terminal domain-containing protein [Oscillospiraceae bacterium]